MHLSARLRRLAIPVALLAAALSLAAVAPASAAPAAGAVTEVFHACKVIGQPSGGVEAVHCADLFEDTTQLPDDFFYAQNEILCQTPAGALRACKEIVEEPELAVGFSTTSVETDAGPAGQCGGVGHTACGTRRVINRTEGSDVFIPGSNQTCGIWAVDVAPDVVLPNGTLVSAPNLATSHLQGVRHCG
jgi:hypothetical protein